MALTVYILELEHEKYYVGRTDNVSRRLGEHMCGKGSEWTKMYKPLNVYAEISDADSFDEDKYTKIMMAEHGIDNVRGGSYTQIELSDQVKQFLQVELSNASDHCFICGSDKHFAKRCKQKQTKTIDNTVQPVCYKCKKTGHFANKCRKRKKRVIKYKDIEVNHLL